MGDPLIEAGFAPTQSSAFGDAAAFMRGYGKGELTETEQVRRRLYSLHLVLVMVIETVYRGHADTKQYDWARHQLNGVMDLLGRRALLKGCLGDRSTPYFREGWRAGSTDQHPTGESVVRDQPQSAGGNSLQGTGGGWVACSVALTRSVATQSGTRQLTRTVRCQSPRRASGKCGGMWPPPPASLTRICGRTSRDQTCDLVRDRHVHRRWAAASLGRHDSRLPGARLVDVAHRDLSARPG